MTPPDGAASATVEVTCDGDGLGRRLVHVQTVQLLPQEAMEAGWSKKGRMPTMGKVYLRCGPRDAGADDGGVRCAGLGLARGREA